MKVELLSEHGYIEAVRGFALSYNTSIERTKQILHRYAWGIPGESKFLESMQVWLSVTAPRFWWQEADTYRVGSTKQSESTMHTLMKRPLDNSNFEYPVLQCVLDELNSAIDNYKLLPKDQKLQAFLYIKNLLPEGFLQERVWGLNYKTIQGIIGQRYSHRLPQWGVFCNYLISNLEYPDFVVKGLNNESGI